MTLPLFDPSPGWNRAAFAERLRSLARERIWFGTSSWKYEGWLDQIYTRSRYESRGKFSKKRFEAECLAEYAETFPIVCGDFSFYQFPTSEYWNKLFSSAPRALRFALKAPEDVTVEVFPRHPRYGPKAGMRNPLFLDADAFRDLFLAPLEPFRNRIPTVIFEFGARSTPVRDFIAEVGAFLGRLPDSFRYAVEVRNPTYLGADYFSCLSEKRTAHVINSWTRMPSLSEQAAMPGVITTDFTVVRALLKPGRPYEEAVAKFSPYEDVQDEYPEGREALKALLQRMREERRAALIFVNNRFEGNAPKTISAVIGE